MFKLKSSDILAEDRSATKSRKSALICLSSTTALADTAVAFVVVSLAVATINSVSKSYIRVVNCVLM